MRVLVACVLLLATTASAQSIAERANRAVLSDSARRDAAAVAERIASRFNEYRQEAGFKRLRRFHCQYMAQLACTAAVMGEGETWSKVESAVYWTADPTAPSKELREVAQYDPKKYPYSGITPIRFSVEVWPTEDPKGYWIATDLHRSAASDAWDQLAEKIFGCRQAVATWWRNHARRCSRPGGARHDGHHVPPNSAGALGCTR